MGYVPVDGGTEEEVTPAKCAPTAACADGEGPLLALEFAPRGGSRAPRIEVGAVGDAVLFCRAVRSHTGDI